MTSDLKESSFIETALKHHSSAQAAIKILQEQLAYLDHIRISAKDTFLLDEEHDFEKSATDLLHSTSNYLEDTCKNKEFTTPPVFSSTLKTYSKQGNDDAVICNLLPFFEGTQDTDKIIELQKALSFRSVKSPNARALTPITKDNLASTSLPLTPFSVTLSSPKSLHGSVIQQKKQSLPQDCLNVTPKFNNSMNLTEVLGRLAYSNMLNSNATEQDSILNSSDTDELIQLLEKISQTGRELKSELQDAKQRESKLKEEVKTLRVNQVDSVVPFCYNETANSDNTLKMKCKKLEEALLSLEEENIKLNRLLKGKPSVNDDRQKIEEENAHLKAELKSLKLQLAKRDEPLQQKHHSKESCLFPNAVYPNGMKNSENQIKIDDLYARIAEKDKRIQKYELELETICKSYEDMMCQHEKLQDKDVCKRKEVLQLCEKYEKLREKYKKMESELSKFRQQDNHDNTQMWALENSLQNLSKENYSLRSQLQAEQRQLSMSKLLLEKDYDALKKRYDGLLLKICKSKYNDVGNFKDELLGDSDRQVKETYHKQNCSGINTTMAHGDSVERRRNKASVSKSALKHSETSSGSTSYMEESSHNRRHTVPRHILPFKNASIKQIDGLRVRSDSDMYRINSSKAMVTSTPLSRNREYKEAANRATMPVTNERNRYTSNAAGSETSPRWMLSHHKPSPRLKQENVKSILVSKSPKSYRSSLSPVDSIRSKTNHAYMQEYLRNTRGNQLRSVSDQSILNHAKYLEDSTSNSTIRDGNTNHLHNKSGIMLPSSRAVGRRRRRLHTAPSVSFLHSDDNCSAKQDVIPYNESPPYSRKYLTNMDDVRLMVDSSNQNTDARTSKRYKSISPSSNTIGRSSSDCSSASVKELAWNNDIGLPQQESTILVETSLADYLSPQKLADNAHSVTGNQDSVENISSIYQSQRSLHLSDLPCDQTAIYDKFRNFDSQFHDYKKPQTIASHDIEIDQRKKGPEINHDQKHVKQKPGVLEKSSNNKAKSKRENLLFSKEEDSESLEQSSVSTTRDHAGRVEFLRDIQINTGVRMPALMRDVTIRDDVIVTENDMDEEIMLGLSRNQQAYADKLVKKYTKKACKKRREMLQKSI